MRTFSEVADGVIVMTSRRHTTTSTLVLGDAGSVVVDPAWDADELAGVAAVLTAVGSTAAAGLATHVHYDHVLWHPSLPPVPRWASPWSVRQWEVQRGRLLQPLVGDLPADLLAVTGRITSLPDAPRTADEVPTAPYPRDTPLPVPYPLAWEGREVILHEHDAHARGHVAVEIPDAGTVLAGDMLSDVELPMPDDEDADLVPYLVGLDRLAPVLARCRVLVPGHGTPTDDPLDRLDADRRYLDAVLSGRDPQDPRIALPGMRELHDRTIAQAAAT